MYLGHHGKAPTEQLKQAKLHTQHCCPTLWARVPASLQFTGARPPSTAS